MSPKVTREPEYYPSPETRELLCLVSKGEEILAHAHAHAIRRAVQAKLKRLIRGRPNAEDEPDPSGRSSPSAARDAQRSQHSALPDR
jgi:hypothetical protein